MILGINRALILVLSLFKPEIKGVLKKIAPLYVNILLFAVLFELALSVIYLVYPLEVLKRGTDILRLSPGTNFNNSTVNQEGYLGRDYREKKERRRIAFIGDSFGVGVVDYSSNFIQMIDDSSQFETVNLSQPGFSPVDYLNQVRIYADKTDADFIFIVFFAGNDILDISMPENNWAFRNMKSVSLIKNIILMKNAKGAGNKESSDIGMNHEMFLEVERERMSVLDSAILSNRWKLFEKSVESIKSILDNKGIPFAFVIIPDQMSVDTLLQNELFFKKGVIDWMAGVERMENVFFKMQINCLNLTDSLKKGYESGKTVYKNDDTHINEEGNYIIYGYLKNYITKVFPN